MFSVQLSPVDRLIAAFMARRACRTWPLLNLVPSPFLRRLLTPTASRLRRSLQRSMLWISLVAEAAILLLSLLR